MADIFSRDTSTFGGSFSADQARVTFPAIGQQGADGGLLVQNLAVNYAQNVARLYEVGSPAIYYIAGRTQGGMNMARVIGPRTIAAAFYSTYGDVCNARTNSLHLSMQTGCGTQEFVRTSVTAHFCVITNISIAFAAQDMLINESLQLMFSSLLYDGGNA